MTAGRVHRVWGARRAAAPTAAARRPAHQDACAGGASAQDQSTLPTRRGKGRSLRQGPPPPAAREAGAGLPLPKGLLPSLVAIPAGANCRGPGLAGELGCGPSAAGDAGRQLWEREAEGGGARVVPASPVVDSPG